MNPTKGSSICTEYPSSSFLLRSKPNNPDSVQKSIEPQVCLQPFTHNSVGGQGSPFSSKDTKSVLIQEQLKGQLGLIARERSETAFILPSKKADRWPSCYWGSPRLTSWQKSSDQKSQIEIYSPQANVKIILFNFNWSKTNCFYSNYILCATMLCYSIRSWLFDTEFFSSQH